ncbi:MAG: hypothetical protein JW850_07315 [Thermoflexales bacterium]|nr:hypothetical protein [Thermoflexales bacterium]
MKHNILVMIVLSLLGVLAAGLAAFAQVGDPLPDQHVTGSPASTRAIYEPAGRVISTTVTVDAKASPVHIWHIETVESGEGIEWGSSLVLDGQGQPHISYTSGYPNYDLKYARRDGNTWHIETVDSAGEIGASSSLALDSAGHPHISYQDGQPNHDLKYARHDGASWHIEAVDSQANVGTASSLALDGSGHPHISYTDGQPNNDLRYAWYDGAVWRFEIADSQGWVSWDSSLALDDAGRPHIGYIDWFGDDLKYARREAVGREAAAREAAGHDGNAWYTTTVDSQPGASWGVSLVLDGQGQPHISYASDYPDFNLRYARREAVGYDGTAWHIETVDSQADVTYTSLVLDEAGQPHIGYCDWHNLKYAWHDGASWHVETIDHQEEGGGCTASLALDGSGRPHISYQAEYPNNELKYAWRDGRFPLFLSKTASPLEGLANRDVVTYTLALSGTGQSAALWDPLPMGVYYVSGSLTSTLSPPAVYSPTARAITWQGMPPIDTLGLVRFQATRGITTEGSLNMSLPIVNIAWLTDTGGGTHVEAAVIVNGYHAYLPFVTRER